MKQKLILALLLAVSNVYATDVSKSWESAPVYIPGNYFPRSTKNLDAVTQVYPVVIYLHGCTGITPHHDRAWAKELADNGYMVIMPDSLARDGRIPDCDPRIKGPIGAFPQAHSYRQEEIGYSLEKIKQSKWADKRNVFIMGHSEGGIATARSAYADVSGIVISGWTCTHKINPKFDGIHSPKSIPVLAVAWIQDPWRQGKPNEGVCSDKADGRLLKQINLQGAGHDTYGHANADVIKFFKDNTK